MKNRKTFKRGIALLCAAALLIGGLSILAINSKAKTVAEQLEADGYTKMTPATFGITEELVYTYESFRQGIYLK